MPDNPLLKKLGIATPKVRLVPEPKPIGPTPSGAPIGGTALPTRKAGMVAGTEEYKMARAPQGTMYAAMRYLDDYYAGDPEYTQKRAEIKKSLRKYAAMSDSDGNMYGYSPDTARLAAMYVGLKPNIERDKAELNLAEVDAAVKQGRARDEAKQASERLRSILEPTQKATEGFGKAMGAANPFSYVPGIGDVERQGTEAAFETLGSMVNPVSQAAAVSEIPFDPVSVIRGPVESIHNIWAGTSLDDWINAQYGLSPGEPVTPKQRIEGAINLVLTSLGTAALKHQIPELLGALKDAPAGTPGLAKARAALEAEVTKLGGRIDGYTPEGKAIVKGIKADVQPANPLLEKLGLSEPEPVGPPPVSERQAAAERIKQRRAETQVGPPPEPATPPRVETAVGPPPEPKAKPAAKPKSPPKVEAAALKDFSDTDPISRAEWDAKAKTRFSAESMHRLPQKVDEQYFREMASYRLQKKHGINPNSEEGSILLNDVASLPAEVRREALDELAPLYKKQASLDKQIGPVDKSFAHSNTASQKESARQRSLRASATDLRNDIQGRLDRFAKGSTPEPKPTPAPKPEPAATGDSRPLKRNYRAGDKNGKVEFASHEQMDLYDIGSVRKRTTTDAGTRGASFNPANAEKANRLAKDYAEKLGITTAEVEARAIDTYNDVRAQMKGVQDGETRKLTYGETAKVETDSLDIPSFADSIRRVAEQRATTSKAEGAAPKAEAPKPTVHKFSSTQVDLPAPEASKVKTLSIDLIPLKDIYIDPTDPSYGREQNPHVTVKYGIHAEDAADVRRALADEPPIELTLGKTSIFPGKDGTPYDVVKIDVDSADLHRLNKKIAAATEVTDTFPDYKPHVTLAYVKKGLGEKYAGNADLEGQKITVDKITFSSKTGETVDIPLGGKRAEPATAAKTPEQSKPDVPEVPVKPKAEKPKVEPKPEPASNTVNDFLREGKAARSGEMSADEIRAAVKRLVDNKDAILAELNKGTIDDLKRIHGSYQAQKKAEHVEAAYDALLQRLVPAESFTWTYPEKFETAIQRIANNLTDADVAAYAEKRKAQIEAGKKALTNPETLSEYRDFIRVKGRDKLTPKQRETYDELVAEAAKTERKQRAEQQATVGGVAAKAETGEGTVTESKIVEHFHTKRGTNVFIVQPEARVAADAFKEMARKARQLGGNYSRSFQGSPAGFQFATREAAESFQSLLKGDSVSRAAELAARAAESQGSAVTRLRDLADRLEESGNERLNAERKENTHKRAAEGEAARAQAAKDIALAKTMRNLADAIDAGEAKHLDGVKAKVHVEELDQSLRSAQYRAFQERQKADSSLRYEKEMARPPELDDIEFAKYPYPEIYGRNLNSFLSELADKPGMMRLVAKIKKMLPKDLETNVVFKYESQIQDLKDLLDGAERFKGLKYEVGRYREDIATYNRFQTMGIQSLPELRAALREFLKFRGDAPRVDPIKAMERELIGTSIPGYFPTPKSLARQLVEAADIQPGMSVLEPSAGKGNIADAIMNAVQDADVATIEASPTLRKILDAKGYRDAGYDFLQHQGEYDRIVMNPPFENGQDILHVRHAYDQLKPGGKLVSIMSEGPFFRSDKASAEFRQWLDEVGGTSEKLPEGSFATNEAERSTGVNTRVVEIEKPAGAAKAETALPTERESIQAERQAAKDRLASRARGMGSKKRGSANLPSPEDWKDLAIIGKSYIDEGVVIFKDWAKSVIKEVGDWVEPHLEELWKRVGGKSEPVQVDGMDLPGVRNLPEDLRMEAARAAQDAGIQKGPRVPVKEYAEQLQSLGLSPAEAAKKAREGTLSPQEITYLGHLQEHIAKKGAALESKYRKMEAAGATPEELAGIESQIEQTRMQRAEVLSGFVHGSSAMGRAMRNLQELNEGTLTLGRFIKTLDKAKSTRTGAGLSPGEISKATHIFDSLQEAVANSTARAAAKLPDVAPEIKLKLQQRRVDAKARIKEKLFGRTNSFLGLPVDPTILGDLVDIGVSFLAEKTYDFGSFSKRMIQETADVLGRHLTKDQLQDIYGRAWKKARREVFKGAELGPDIATDLGPYGPRGGQARAGIQDPEVFKARKAFLDLMHEYDRDTPLEVAANWLRGQRLANPYSRVVDSASHIARIPEKLAIESQSTVLDKLLFPKLSAKEGAAYNLNLGFATRESLRAIKEFPAKFREYMKHGEEAPFLKEGEHLDVFKFEGRKESNSGIKAIDTWVNFWGRLAGTTDIVPRDAVRSYVKAEIAQSFAKRDAARVKLAPAERGQYIADRTRYYLEGVDEAGARDRAVIDAVSENAAEEYVFGEDNFVSQMIRGAVEKVSQAKGRNAGGWTRFIIDTLFSFPRIFVNFAKLNARFAGGALEAAGRVAYKKVRSEPFTIEDRRLITRLVAQNLTGIAAVYAGGKMASAGYFGDPQVDKYGRIQWPTWVKWSLEQIPGVPAMMLQGAGRELINQAEKDKRLTAKQAEAARRKLAWGIVTNQPAYTGIKNVADLIGSGDPDKWYQYIAKTAGTMVIPGGVRGTAYMIDEYNGVQGRKMSGPGDIVKGQIPVLRQSLPERGVQTMTEVGVRFSDPVVKEIRSLGVEFGLPTKGASETDEAFKKRVGPFMQRFADELDRLVKSNLYKNLSREQKIRALRGLRSRFGMREAA